MSVITKETAERLNVKPGRHKVKFTRIDGIVKECPTAKIALWLPGERKLTRTEVLVGAANTNILGFDVLSGRVWKLPDGSLWSFAGRGDGEIAWLEEDETKAINLLEMSIPLPPSRITNVKQYPLPAAAHSGIDGVVTDLEKRGVITRTHSPYNSPIWPVKKPNGQWRLTIDYRRSNANTAPLTAAVPNIAELVTQIEGASHPWMATLDVKDMFFMIPLQERDKAEFAFTWKGIRYTFNRLPQGYKHSPTIAHSALAKVLSEIPSPQGITIYQYIDDILIGGETSEEVRHTMEGVREKLIILGLDIPSSKCQGPAQEVKFLGVWWIKGAASIPPDALEKIEHGQNPSSIKELQQVLGSLSYWRKHIPGFSIIAHPLYNLLRKVRKGTAPPAGIAQKPTAREWYAYLESINDIMPITEGSIKVSKLQKDIDSTLLFQTPPSKPSPIQEALPLKEGSDLKGVRFTDASSYRQNHEWNYKAVALEVATGEKLSETGKGSAQVGELRAVLLAARHGASHIYTDSYAVFKGATEWVGHWAVNDWQVNRVLVWQTDSWKQLLEIGEQRLLHIGWVKGHDRSASIAAQFNQQVDSLTRLQKIDVVSNEHEWERLLEWLHIKRGHTGRADLYREGIARGWPVSVKLCEQVVTACSQCRLRLNKDHPSKAPPLHIRDKKTLWHTWQIDYIGPLRPSGGKKCILVGVEVISGVTMATAVTAATGENTVHSLKEWFRTLPLPEEIQSDNGSHFSATVVQDWAKEEGIRWVFHTPYYPQANGIVERTNGLVKRFAKTHESGWHL
ncbi:pol-like protein ENS-3 [Grus japonensis]|uniref:ribonuclease H n=1 Tax=Grus japonensis TaxID=30415 RepID=A0ABC9YJB3_GRUJA